MTIAVVPMYDAIGANAAALPPGQAAGYATGSGDVPWSAAGWAAHPGAVRIAQSPYEPADDVVHADVLDVETGAATPAMAPGWYRGALAAYVAGARAGQRYPAVYCNLSTLTAVADALVTAGLALSGPALWLAEWSLSEASAAALVRAAAGPWPVIGVQYRSTASYDVSVMSAAWLAGVSGPPPPPAPAAPPFPYPAGDYLGVVSADPHGHSGFLPADRPHVAAWQARMAARGWAITADGLFGAQSAAVARGFQAQVHLTADGLVGPRTWTASFTAPVTP
jgi:peptidoglycan hydrolase-like protein with peptidoglycan-binding domain